MLVKLTKPEVVGVPHDTLEVQRDVHVDVLVEAGLEGAGGGKRGPVVAPPRRARASSLAQLLLHARQGLGLALELLLSPLNIQKTSFIFL